jgi:hypothetical protein
MGLYEYLGMIPVAVECIPGEDAHAAGQLRDFLMSRGLSAAYGANPADVNPDYYFGDDQTGMDLVLSSRCNVSVGLFNRASTEPEFVEKAFLGGTGTLWILETIFHAVRRFPE